MNVHIPRSHDSCCTVTLAANLKYYFLKIGDHTVMASTKNDYFFWQTHITHLQNWRIDLLFKNNRIHKHGTSFKTSSLFCVDAINVWSHLANNWKKKKEGKERLTVKSLDVFFFTYSTKKIYMIIKKQNVLYVWRDVFCIFWMYFGHYCQETFQKPNQKSMQKGSIIDLRVGSK